MVDDETSELSFRVECSGPPLFDDATQVIAEASKKMNKLLFGTCLEKRKIKSKSNALQLGIG